MFNYYQYVCLRYFIVATITTTVITIITTIHQPLNINFKLGIAGGGVSADVARAADGRNSDRGPSG